MAEPRRADTAEQVDQAIRDYMVAVGKLAPDEDVDQAIVAVKVRRRGPDGPVGPGRRYYFSPGLPVDSDEASGMLSRVVDALRSGGAEPA